MSETKPGNGSTDPFGDGKGNEAAGPSGSNDFLKNPSGGGSKTGGRDFTKESRDQKTGAPGYNPNSVPAGGPLPFSSTDPTRPDATTHPDGAAHKPFKI